jgi:hypothetical protein
MHGLMSDVQIRHLFMSRDVSQVSDRVGELWEPSSHIFGQLEACIISLSSFLSYLVLHCVASSFLLKISLFVANSH